MKDIRDWKPPVLPAHIPTGDMPGDKVAISEHHIDRANRIFPDLMDEIEKIKREKGSEKIVVTVCGGSGVGKSGIAAVLSYYLKEIGIGSYTLSGDNYPHRIPEYNDAERLQLFREGAIKGMIRDGVYTKERYEIVHELQLNGDDANPEHAKKYDWYSSYLNGGHKALEEYLGTDKELGFGELEDILNQFKSGAKKIWLRRMGRSDTELWYDEIDFKNVGVLMIEWTHGNSDYYKGVDIPILLNSTPQETLEYRMQRNRDGAIDSPFTAMVLEIEQELLKNQAHKAKIIIAKDGERLTYPKYCKVMGIGGENEQKY